MTDYRRDLGSSGLTDSGHIRNTGNKMLDVNKVSDAARTLLMADGAKA